jgi:hypothetical protein
MLNRIYDGNIFIRSRKIRRIEIHATLYVIHPFIPQLLCRPRLRHLLSLFQTKLTHINKILKFTLIQIIP